MICPLNPSSAIQSTIDKIKRASKSTYRVLDFDSFSREYPFLCCFNNLRVKGMNSSLLTYPSEIIKYRLYLGNAIHSGNAKVLRDLQISHIVNVSRLMDNVFEHNASVPIHYHRIPISDFHAA